MIQGKYLSIIDDLSSIIRIRKEVFENELHLIKNGDIDETDKQSINVIVFDNQLEVATGRICLNNNNYTIDMVCVLKEYRNNGYGEFVVRLLADRALLAGAKTISLISPENTIAFFEKLFFKKVDSTPVTNGNSAMVLNMADLTTPCGHNCTKH